MSWSNIRTGASAFCGVVLEAVALGLVSLACANAQILLDGQVVEPVAAESVPRFGTFYLMSLSTHPPPLPFNPFPDLPAYSLGGNQFLVDDTTVDYTVRRQLAPPGRTPLSGGARAMMYSITPPSPPGGTNGLPGTNDFVLPVLTNCPSYSLSPGGAVYLTNLAWGGSNICLSVAGGDTNLSYDLFRCTNSGGANMVNTNTLWTHVMRVSTCQTYLLTNQPFPNAFYILGTPEDTDGDTLTDAYETLVSRTDPNVPDTAESLGTNTPTGQLLIDQPAECRVSTFAAAESLIGDCNGETNVVLEYYAQQSEWARLLGGGMAWTKVEWNCNPTNSFLSTADDHMTWDTNGVPTCGEEFPGPRVDFKSLPWEHCAIVEPWPFVLGTNVMVPAFQRNAQTHVELFSGGPTFSLRTHVFRVHVGAWVRTFDPSADPPPFQVGTNIPPQLLAVGNLNLDACGDVYLIRQDQTTVDVTPTVTGVASNAYSNYVFTVSVERVKIPLVFRNSGTVTQKEVNGVGYQVDKYEYVADFAGTNLGANLPRLVDAYYNLEETDATVPDATVFQSGWAWHRDVAVRRYYWEPTSNQVVPFLPREFSGAPPGNGNDTAPSGTTGSDDAIPDLNRLVLICDYPGVEIMNTNNLALRSLPTNSITAIRFAAREWVTWNGAVASETLRWHSWVTIKQLGNSYNSWVRVGRNEIEQDGNTDNLPEFTVEEARGL